jgi:hypothetical protein
MQIYNVNRDGDIEFDINELKALPTILKLIRRDNGVVEKGRVFKKRTDSELRYVWFMFNFNSPGIRQGYNDNALHNEGVHFAGLDDQWKPDDAVQSAIAECKKFYGGVSTSYARTLLQTLQGSKQVIDVLKDSIMTDIEELKNCSTSEEDKVKRRALAKAAVADLKALMEIADTLPKAINTTEKAVEQALRDLTEKTSKVWGGGEVGNRE